MCVCVTDFICICDSCHVYVYSIFSKWYLSQRSGTLLFNSVVMSRKSDMKELGNAIFPEAHVSWKK